MIFRWVHVLNNSRTEALEKAFGDSDKAEVLVSVVLVMKEVVLLHPTSHFSSWNVAKKMNSCFFNLHGDFSKALTLAIVGEPF